MRWYRSRLILLGLTLCVVHVVSGSCRPGAKQVAASVKRSDIVFEAKLDSWTADEDVDNTLGLNLTVKKGLSKGMKSVAKFRNGNRLALRIFTDAQLKTCVQSIDTKAKGAYFFFLKNDRTKSGLFELQAAPARKVKSLANVVAEILNPPQTPVKAPIIVHISKGSVVKLDNRLKLDCKADGYPSPTVTWFKDGKSVNATKGRVKVKTAKSSPSQSAVTKTLKISKLKNADMGHYSCVASNSAGNATQHLTINASLSDSLTSFNLKTEVHRTVEVKAFAPITKDDDTTTNGDWENKTVPCDSEGYCLNGGSCRMIKKMEIRFCKCLKEYDGQRCELQISRLLDEQASLQLQRTLIYIGIVIAVLVFITICIASYILSKRHVKRRSKETPASVSHNSRGDPVITAFKETKGKRIESFSSSGQVNSKKELNQTKNDTTVPFPPVEKRNGSYPGPRLARQRLAANSYYDNNPDQSENIEMKPVDEAVKTEMSHDVPLTLSPPLISSPPEAMQKSEGRIVGKNNHLPLCESKSDRDFTRIGNHLNENSPLLNEAKMRQSQTCPKMNSPIRDKQSVESSDSDEEMEIPNAKYDSLHISEDELSPSKDNLDSSSGSGDLSPTRLARREDKVKGLLPSSNAARPAMRKYQSEEGPALNIQTNKIHKLHLQDSIRSHSLDEPSSLEMGIHPTHLNSTMPGSPDGEHCKNFSHSHSRNHNSYDPNEDDVPWDGNKARSFSQLSEEEMYRLRDVLPNQQPIPI